MSRIVIVFMITLLFLTACTKAGNKTSAPVEDRSSTVRPEEKPSVRQPAQPVEDSPPVVLPKEGQELAERPPMIMEDDLVIAGISIRNSYVDILNNFGEPVEKIDGVKQESIHDPNSIIYWETWVYDGIGFMFWSVRDVGEAVPEHPDQLYSIIVETSNFETARGVKVGDPLSKVFELYGEKEIYFPDMTSFLYEDEYSFLILEFVTAGGTETKVTDKIVRIELHSVFD